MSFERVRLPHDEDWIWRPVARGWCKAESLFNGAFDLERIAMMNDAIDVADENEYRAHEAARRS